MIVFHAKPAGTSLAWAGQNIVGRIDVDLAFENARGWIGGELIQDQRIVSQRIGR